MSKLKAIIVNTKDLNKLIITASQILADESCDNQCLECPIVWCCGGPECIPFNQLKEFIERNKNLRIEDDKLNTDVKFENLNDIANGLYR